MDSRELLGPWIRRFLLEHVIGERNLSPNTQRSYRDTLTMLLPFVASRAKKPWITCVPSIYPRTA
jgi:integrase/recombinase XerD